MKRKLFFAVLLSCTFLLSSCVGTYFVNFALDRDVAGSQFESADGDTGFIPKSNTVLVENYRSLVARTQTWLDSTEKEDWSITTSDGFKLNGDFFPCENSHKYVIVIHGYTGTKKDMLPYGEFFYQWGYNVLAPDNRSHGNSEGKYIGMGWLDSQDILLWIDKIIKADPQASITMIGVSMGGATVMMTSGLDLPANVKCLIEDCGYDTVWNEFAFQLKAMFKLPTWPVLNLSDKASKRLAGYSLKEASSVERLENAKLPMLFIHGTADTFVPYSMLDKNVEAIGSVYHEVLRVDKATHGVALYQDPELYITTVKNFVDRYIQ